MVNLPLDLAAAVEAEAARAETSYTGIVRLALARYLGLPDPAPMRRVKREGVGVERLARVPVWREAVEYLSDDEWRSSADVAAAWQVDAGSRSRAATGRALRDAVEHGAAESDGDGRGGRGRVTRYRRAA